MNYGLIVRLSGQPFLVDYSNAQKSSYKTGLFWYFAGCAITFGTIYLWWDNRCSSLKTPGQVFGQAGYMFDETTEALKVAIEKRVLNEFGSKILNEERMDKVLESRKSSRLSHHSDMAFHCECDDKDCEETIKMSTEEYQRVHTKTRNFIVVPSHVRLDLEEVLTTFNTYVLVGKYFPHRPSS